MPHGVKVNHAGTKVYVTCMNSDEVLEIDRASLAIARRHKTGEGMLPQAMPMKMGHGGAQGGSRRTALHDACMPTFVSVSPDDTRSEEHTSELQSHSDLVCRLLLEKKKKKDRNTMKEP